MEPLSQDKNAVVHGAVASLAGRTVARLCGLGGEIHATG